MLDLITSRSWRAGAKLVHRDLVHDSRPRDLVRRPSGDLENRPSDDLENRPHDLERRPSDDLESRALRDLAQSSVAANDNGTERKHQQQASSESDVLKLEDLLSITAAGNLCSLSVCQLCPVSSVCLSLKAVYSFYEKPITELRSVTCHMTSHNVTCHPTQVNVPHLNPSQTNQYFIHLPRRDGRLS